MKQIAKQFAVALTLVFSALALCACGLFDANVVDDRYPYDVAVEQGYGGSEGQWLASQDTGTLYHKLYEEARLEGYTNGYLQFLKDLGVGQNEAYLQSSLNSVVKIVSAFSGTSAGEAGSGVIVWLDKAEGEAYVATNYHVVYNARGHASDIYVWLYGGTGEASAMTATYVCGALNYDVALLHIAPEDVVVEQSTSAAVNRHTNADILKDSSAEAATFADFDSITVGEQVYAVGNADNKGITVTGGIVSVDFEEITMYGADDKTEVTLLEIRTDAAINHGNSGGAMFNAQGELIGIVDARSEKEGVVGFGYAIPLNRAFAALKNAYENLAKRNGAVYCAKLGITYSTEGSRAVYDEETGKTYIEEKIVVKSVDMLTAASTAGLDTGDTIVAATLNGKKVYLTRAYKIGDVLLGVREGDTLQLTVSRGGVTRELSVTFNMSAWFTQYN